MLYEIFDVVCIKRSGICNPEQSYMHVDVQKNMYYLPICLVLFLLFGKGEMSRLKLANDKCQPISSINHKFVTIYWKNKFFYFIFNSLPNTHKKKKKMIPFHYNYFPSNFFKDDAL